MTEPTTSHAFDAYAAQYEEALNKGIAVSGESKEFFARGRVAWVARCLRELNQPTPRRAMDFGCGTGTATPYFFEELGAEKLIGVEVSKPSLEIARAQYGQHAADFVLLDEHQPAGDIDLAYCNGVFHHISPAVRQEPLQVVRKSLRPGGLFAFWENNPWNPGTRIVMSRIPFDRDAIPISPPDARRLLLQSGFEIVRVDFLFIFPHMMRWLRGLEQRLSRWPLGAQYQVLCRRPISDAKSGS